MKVQFYHISQAQPNTFLNSCPNSGISSLGLVAPEVFGIPANTLLWEENECFVLTVEKVKQNMNEVTWVDVLYVSLHQKYTLENWDPFTGMETNTVSNELLGTIVIMRHVPQ